MSTARMNLLTAKDHETGSSEEEEKEAYWEDQVEPRTSSTSSAAGSGSLLAVLDRPASRSSQVPFVCAHKAQNNRAVDRLR